MSEDCTRRTQSRMEQEHQIPKSRVGLETELLQTLPNRNGQSHPM